MFRHLFSAVTALAIALALCGAAKAQTTVGFGPFSVYFVPPGQNFTFRGESYTPAAQVWQQDAIQDLAAAIQAWDNVIGNPYGTRPLSVYAVWDENLGGALARSNNGFVVTGTTAFTNTEYIWRAGQYLPPTLDAVWAFDPTPGGAGWFFGQGSIPFNQLDFCSVAAHELGHTLGFNSCYYPVPDNPPYTDAWYAWLAGPPVQLVPAITAWDGGLRDAPSGGNQPSAGTTGTPGNFNETANPCYWEGPLSQALNGGSRVAIDSAWGLYHLSDDLYPQAVMSTYTPYGQQERQPTPLESAMMQDMGWLPVKTWTNGAQNLYWGAPANWSPLGVPTATDEAAFTSLGLIGGDLISILGGSWTIDSLTINGAPSFTIANDGTLTLVSGNITRTAATGGIQTIACPVTLGENGIWDVGGTGALVIFGPVGQAAPGIGIEKRGSGVVILGFGAAANTYTGVTNVVFGTLALNGGTVQTIAGNVQVQTGGVLSQAAVGLSSEQIANTANVTVNGGTWSLVDNAETINTLAVNSLTVNNVLVSAGLVSIAGVTTPASLTLSSLSMTEGTITTTGSGTLVLAGNLLVPVQAPWPPPPPPPPPPAPPPPARLPPTINGNIDLAAGVRTFTISQGGAWQLVINAAISNGGIIKDGPSTLVFGDAVPGVPVPSTYGGGTTVNAGLLDVTSTGQKLGTGNVVINSGAVVRLASPYNLGATANVLVNAGGALGLAYDGPPPPINPASSGVLAIDTSSYAQPLDLSLLGNGTMFLGTTLYGTYSGSLAPGAGSTYRLGGGGGQLVIAAPLVGTSSVQIGFAGTGGSGYVAFTAPNTYTGLTNVVSGTLELYGGTVQTIVGDVLVQAGGVLSQAWLPLSSEQIADTANVTINDGTWSLTENTETIGALSVSRGTIYGWLWGGLTVTGPQPAYVLEGSTVWARLTTGSGGLYLSDGSTISGDLVLNGNVTHGGPAGSAAVTLSGRVDLNGGNREFNVASDSSLNVTGLLVGVNSALTKTGGGTLLLASENYFDGGTRIAGGWLVAGQPGALGDTYGYPPPRVELAGGNLRLLNAGTNYNLDVVVNQDATIDLDPAVSGALFAINTLQVADRTLRLTGGSGTTLRVNGQTTLTGTAGPTFDVAADTTLDLAAGVDAGTSGTGGLTKTGDGTLLLGGDSVYAGPTSVTAGTVALGSSLSGTSRLTIGGGATAATFTSAGTIIGSPPITINNRGTLNADAPDAIGAGSITVNAGGTFNVNTAAGASGRDVVNNASGTVRATVPQALDGVRVINFGLVELAADDALGTPVAIVNNPGSYYQFSAPQTTSPTLDIPAGVGLLGNTTSFVYGSGPGRVSLAEGAGFESTSGNVPTRAELGGSAILCRPIFATGSTASYSAGDDGATAIYKGLSFGAWSTPATGTITFTGTITDTSSTGPGGTNSGVEVLLDGRQVVMNASTRLNSTDTTRGVQFNGPGRVTLNATPGGSATVYSGVGVFSAALNTTNDSLVALPNVAGNLANRTLNLVNCKLTAASVNDAYVAGTVNFGACAALHNSGTNLRTGTFNFAPTAIFRMGGNQRLTSGATFNFADGAMLAVDCSSNLDTALAQLPTNVDYVVYNTPYLNNLPGLVLGDGRTLATPWNVNSTVSFDNPSAPSQLTATPDAGSVRLAGANGRTLTINGPVNMPDADVAINDTAGNVLYVPADTNSFTRQVGGSPLNGTVVLTGSVAVESLRVRAGTLRFQLADGSPAIASSESLTIDAGARVQVAGSTDPFAQPGPPPSYLDVENNGILEILQDATAGPGRLEGAGTTTLAAGAELTASYLRQGAVVLSGTSGRPAIVRIRPSGGAPLLLDPRGPAPVPEPGTLLLLALGAIALLPAVVSILRRR